MRATFYPLGLFCGSIAGWLSANHWTHGTPLWWALPPFIGAIACLYLSERMPKP